MGIPRLLGRRVPPGRLWQPTRRKRRDESRRASTTRHGATAPWGQDPTGMRSTPWAAPAVEVAPVRDPSQHGSVRSGCLSQAMAAVRIVVLSVPGAETNCREALRTILSDSAAVASLPEVDWKAATVIGARVGRIPYVPRITPAEVSRNRLAGHREAALHLVVTPDAASAAPRRTSRPERPLQLVAGAVPERIARPDVQALRSTLAL